MGAINAHHGLMLTGAAGDPYFSSVASLLHFEGSNGSTTFTDVKGKTWTASGNAQISTAKAQFGTASGAFDGTGDFVTGPSHADFGFGTGDWTIEFWMNRNPAGGDQCIFDNRNASNAGVAIYAGVSASSDTVCVANNSGVIISNILSPTAGTWYHIAVVRDSGVLRAYANGVRSGSAQPTDTRTYASTPVPVLGTNYLNSQGFNGYLDDLRITKGVCRYPSGTTFSVPAAAFPDS